RLRGGAIGAGVPRPSNAKRANESNNPGTPAIMNASPTKRVASAAKKGGRNSQCVINQGMTPANIAGATTKNSAEPTIAVIFDMRPPNLIESGHLGLLIVALFKFGRWYIADGLE